MIVRNITSTPVSSKSVVHVAPLRSGRARRSPRLTALRASSKDESPKANVGLGPSPSASSSSDQGPATPPAPADDKSVMMQRIKSFGIAGTLSYVITEIAFWAIALPGAWIGESRGESPGQTPG